MIPDLIRDLLEDYDLLSYIKQGAYADTYDPQAKAISDKLHKDLTVSQIQSIVWDAFYAELCVCIVPKTNETFVLDESDALVILPLERFENIATMIRHLIEY